MKTVLLAALAILPFSISALAQAEQGTPPTPMHAAVFDFTDGSPQLKGQGKSVGELLNATLSIQDGIFLVERAELEKILSEQELGLGGNISPDSAIRVGQLTGAQLLITGRVFMAANKTYVVAKVISAETSRVHGATVSYKGEEEFDGAITQLSEKVAGLITEKGDTLRSNAESFEEIVARLKQGLKPELPKVYVHVTEEHLRVAVPDPACETEIQKLLEACGFDIVKDAASADISITGEAFSQLGSRRGNLVACRARAEIKITSVKANKLLRSDRITVGAVDLAEEVAGKSALQKAGLRLAETFIMKQKQ